MKNPENLLDRLDEKTRAFVEMRDVRLPPRPL
jgi:hypothetical protein